LGARYDLPLPLWLYLLGAGAAVAASFALLALLRTSSQSVGSRSLVWAKGMLPAWLVWVLQVMSVGMLVVITVAGFVGNQNPFKNITPVFVWVIWWVGMTFLAAFVVNPWRLVNPAAVSWCWLARLLRVQYAKQRYRQYPAWLGVWPAGILFLVMAWLELVAPSRDAPRNIAIAVMAYVGLTWAGCYLFGSQVWLRKGDPFSVAFGILGRFAPLQIAGTGQRWCWLLQPYAVGLLARHSLPISMSAFTMLMLATVSVDGLLETPVWAAVVEAAVGTGSADDASGEFLATVLLCMAPLVFGGVYVAVVSMMRLASGEPGHLLGDLAGRFVLSLVPIAIAYHLAHYLSFLLLAGQLAIPLISDPFGWGWDLFGTVLHRINIGIVNARFIWFLAVGAIVVGHVVATWLAHETALIVFRTSKAARRSQVPMLVLMVGYTVLSLWILSQPIVE
jgi:hypothetical protein